MAITGIPTFVDGEIPPAAKLNQLGDAITNKFGGAITPGDMTWPFVVEGNIDFDRTWGIVGLRQFWNIINVDEYVDFDAAITAAESMDGGACVLIPPSFSIEADNIDIDASNITIMGCGKSSVLKLTPGASNFLLRTGSGSLSNITLENLTIDGQGTGTGSPLGVIVRQVTGFAMRDVHIKNFKGSAVQLTHDGTASHSCIDAQITGTKFTGGLAAHLQVIDIDGLIISDMKSETCATTPIFMEPSAAGGLIKRIKMSNVDIDGPSGVGVTILGASATANDNWSLIDLRDIQVYRAGSDAFNFGLAAKVLKYATMVGCSAPNATGGGAKVNISEGELCDNFFRSAGGDGIDMLATENSVIQGNNVTDATGAAIVVASEGGNYIGQNPGYVATIISGSHADASSYTKSDAPGDLNWSYTIPAYTLRVGDTLEVEAYASYTHSAGALDFELQIGGVDGGSSGSKSANVDYVVRWKYIIVALDGAGTNMQKLFVGSGPDVVLVDSDITIDWKVDQELTINATSLGAGSTLAITRINVTIHGGA